MSSTFAEPPRHKERTKPVEVPTVFAAAGPDPMTGGDDLWHLYVPGADSPPCGGEYHQPRRTPRPHVAIVAEGKPYCELPECFG